jgi:hypothetical protein
MGYECTVCGRRIPKRSRRVLPWSGAAWVCCLGCADTHPAHTVLFPGCGNAGHTVRDHNITLANHAATLRIFGDE